VDKKLIEKQVHQKMQQQVQQKMQQDQKMQQYQAEQQNVLQYVEQYIEQYKITKRIEFCYGHRLIEHKGKCRYLHGHNALVEIDIKADKLDKDGMVMDFSDIRDIVKGWVDTNLDHRMILCKNDPVLKTLQEIQEPVYAIEENPTAENIAKLIYTEIKKLGLEVTEVRLWETPSSCAVYTIKSMPS
jgi:6-pyruvoyltetrahydropterin/6-carboxytetrahydropterin synthase